MSRTSADPKMPPRQMAKKNLTRLLTPGRAFEVELLGRINRFVLDRTGVTNQLRRPDELTTWRIVRTNDSHSLVSQIVTGPRAGQLAELDWRDTAVERDDELFLLYHRDRESGVRDLMMRITLLGDLEGCEAARLLAGLQRSGA